MRWFPLFLLLAASVSAQESDARMSKILNPDLNASANLSGKSFYGGKSFNTQPAYSKPFYLSKLFSPKKFDAQSYQAGRYWTGQYYQGNGKDLATGRSSIPNAARKVALKDAAVRKDREADKKQPIREFGRGTRSYEGQEKEKMDQAIDPNKPLPGWSGETKVMTMEQLRDLLNKTR